MSRRGRRVIVIAFLLLTASICWFDQSSGLCLRNSISSRFFQAPDFRNYHQRSFKVINVVDGDTLDVYRRDGKYDHTRIRLLGIDTPETNGTAQSIMYYGPQATKYASQLALGKQITIILDSFGPARDKYNRLLAYIQLPGGQILNEQLISNGFGYADLRFNHSKFDKYIELQRKTQQKQKGLWKEVKSGQLPKWLQRENPELLRP